MGQLDELRTLIATTYKEVTDPAKLKEMAKFQAVADAIEKEQNEKDASYAEILKDYKDLLLSQGSKDKPNDIEGNTPKSFEEFLDEAIKNQNKEKK